MATDPNTLLELAKCYDCYGSAGTWNLFELGLWKAYLLTLDPVADTSPNALLEAAKCYDCNGAPGEWQLFKLGLLKKILLAGTPGADTSANALLEAAKCYDCYGGGGMWMLLELGLLNQIAAGGSSSVQDMQVAWTPTNIKLGQMMGFSVFNSSTKLPGITSLTFNQATSTEAFDIEGALGLTSLSFPNLVSLTDGGYIDFSGSLNLTSASIPLLSTSSGQIIFNNCPSLTSVNLSSLTSANAQVALGGTGLSSISLPVLTNAPALYLPSNPNLTNVSLPLFVTVQDTITLDDNPLLVSFSLPSLVPLDGRVFTANGSGLNAASVNGILHRHVLNPAYVSGIIDLSGGTNAAPSGAGIADKATLIGRGVTVNTN